MLLSEALERMFSRNSVARGYDYADSETIQDLEGSPWEAFALIHGTETYDTSVSVEPLTGTDALLVRALCSCPHAADGAACKHMWALLVAAEDDGYLDGPVPVTGKVTLALGSNGVTYQAAPPASARPSPHRPPPVPPEQRVALGQLSSLEMLADAGAGAPANQAQHGRRRAHRERVGLARHRARGPGAAARMRAVGTGCSPCPPKTGTVTTAEV